MSYALPEEANKKPQASVPAGGKISPLPNALQRIDTLSPAKQVPPFKKFSGFGKGHGLGFAKMWFAHCETTHIKTAN